MASARARPISGVVTAAGGPMIFLIMALKSPLSSAIARLVRSSSRSSLLSPTNTPVFSIPFDDAPNPTMRGIASNARFLYTPSAALGTTSMLDLIRGSWVVSSETAQPPLA